MEEKHIFLYLKFIVVLSIIVVTISGCGPRNVYAPVATAWRQPAETKGIYYVRPGDTLYAIAWRYDKDYRELARINHLKEPYSLRVGQMIHIKEVKKSSTRSSYQTAKKAQSTKRKKPTTKKVTKAKAQKTSKKPTTKKVTKAKTQKTSKKPTKTARVSRWNWPAKGKIIAYFDERSGGNKGIDIAGRKGATIVAAASGQVAYSGKGLPGYGNLLIIKHTNDYLSAYAHSRRLLVKEGEQVKAGQKIAEMGNTGAQQVNLHFEIRKAGKPIDPLRYLGKSFVG